MRLKSLFFLFVGLLLLATGSYADSAANIQYRINTIPINLSLKGNINYIKMARDNFYGKEVIAEPTHVSFHFEGANATKTRKRVQVILDNYLPSAGNKFELRFTLENLSHGVRYLSSGTMMIESRKYNTIDLNVDANVRQVSFTIYTKFVAVATAPESSSIIYETKPESTSYIGFLTVYDQYNNEIMGTHGTRETIIQPHGLYLKVESSTCTLLSDNNINVNMPTIQSFKLRQQGEINAGNFELRIGECGASTFGQFSSNAIEKIFITFSDASTPTNYSDLLSLSDEATASGVGIKIYPENSTTAVQFGPPSRIKGNHNSMPFGNYIKPANDYGSASQRYVVKYALDSSKPLKGGKVIARATFTFSYQ
ncbi:fimbrial protein [Gallibacterium anatis]|uniref:fimbrial protein n=1 Tax=Gallibacterium anatis TaxID=750 RepID=UPI002550D9F9|nr:fimbrial protein [Gallibacterium anatis]WIM82172.1 fimbrial protein [Gallibacterium anatis]